MPLKISGLKTSTNVSSDNIFINTIKFTDSSQNKNNVNVTKLLFKESKTATAVEKWVQAFTITPISSSSYIDLSTVKATVTNKNSSTGVGNRDIVVANALQFTDDATKNHLYYGDFVTFSASPIKGYANPTISTALSSGNGVRSNIDISSYITTTGTLVTVAKPTVDYCGSYNTQTGGSVSGTIRNNASYPAVLWYGVSPSNTIGPVSWAHTSDEIAAGGTASITISPNTYYQYLHIYAVYGASTSETTVYTISMYYPPAPASITPSYASVRVGSTITLEANDPSHPLSMYYDPIEQPWDWIWSFSPRGLVEKTSAARIEYVPTIEVKGVSVGTLTVTATLRKGIPKVRDPNTGMPVSYIWNELSTVTTALYVVASDSEPTYSDGSGCVSSDTNMLINLNGETKQAKDVIPNDYIVGCDENGNLIKTKVLNRYIYDKCEFIYTIYIENNYCISVTGNHPLLTKNGYRNILGIDDYKKLDISDEVYTTSGYKKICYITKTPHSERVYNFYTDCDNFVANGVIVACENPDKIIIGENASFYITEGNVHDIHETYKW